MVVGTSASITCSNPTRTVTISPVLPTGLSYSNGVISGTPSEPSPYTTYTITANRDRGTFVLGSIVCIGE